MTVSHYISLLGLDISHFTGRVWVGTRPMRPGQRSTLETIFCENSYFATSRLLQVILREGYRERCCEGCGLSEWRDRPIPLEVDHINGQNHDHRLESTVTVPQLPRTHADLARSQEQGAPGAEGAEDNIRRGSPEKARLPVCVVEAPPRSVGSGKRAVPQVRIG